MREEGGNSGAPETETLCARVQSGKGIKDCLAIRIWVLPCEIDKALVPDKAK